MYIIKEYMHFIVECLFLPKEHIFLKAALIMIERIHEIFNRNKMPIEVPFARVE